MKCMFCGGHAVTPCQNNHPRVNLISKAVQILDVGLLDDHNDSHELCEKRVLNI